MYSIYNLDTLEQFIDTMHKMLTKQPGMKNYLPVNLILVSLVVIKGWSWQLCHRCSFVFNNNKRKICQDVCEIHQLIVNVCQSDKSSFKGIFAYFSTVIITFNDILGEVQKAIQITNPDYNRVIKKIAFIL